MKNKTKKKFTVKPKRNQGSGMGTALLNLPNGVSLFKLKEGTKKATIDILPYTVTSSNHMDKDNGAEKGEIWYRRPYMVHHNVGVDNKSYICLKSIGKKCPICEYQTELFKTDKESAIKLYPKQRSLFAIIPKDMDVDEEISIWDMSDALFHNELVDTLDEDDSNSDFADIEDGKTLEITFKWKELGDSKFPETKRIDFIEREDPYDEDVLDDVPALDDCLNTLSYEELNNIFMGIDEDDVAKNDDDAEEDEKPRKKKSTKADKKESNVEWSWKSLLKLSENKLIKIIEEDDLDIDPDDYEDDEDALREAVAEALDVEIPKKSSFREKDEDDDDNEKEEKQAAKRTRSTGEGVRNKKVVDDDDEDNTDDEEEQPVKKSKTTRTQTKETTTGCPHNHKFGKDLDEYPECNKCKVWEACLDENEKLNKKRK